MTRYLRFAAWAVFAFLPASLALAAPAGQIAESTGFVTVAAPQQAPKSAKKGSGVEEGQVVTTGTNGQAVIRFQDGQVIALKSNSIFKVNSYKYDQAAPEKGESLFALLQGGLRAITGLIGDRNRARWRLATPTATAGIRGTDFLVAIQQGTFFKVNSGSIAAINAGGTTVIGAGEAGAVASASSAGSLVPLSELPAGVFTELEAMSLTGALGGPAAAAGAGAATVGGVPAWAIGVGIAVGVGAAAAGGGGGDDAVTTTHH
jgi:hypothetical protein